jgi:uncharacterized protein YndB with AHSA1/START domain
MSMHSTQHSTIVFGGTFDAPVARVYSAFSDPLERARLGAASERSGVILDSTDFRVGGSDEFRFGPKRDPRFRCRSTYLDIVPQCRIVSNDVIYERETRLSIAVTTLEFRPKGLRTQVKITAQLVSLDEADMIDDLNLRHATLIESLGRYLELVGR